MARLKPNLAGQFILEEWGCGTSCSTGAVLNAVTGEVIMWPFYVAQDGGADWGSEWLRVETRSKSSLVVFMGMINDEGVLGRHFFRFDGANFIPIKSIELGPPEEDD